VAATLNAQNQNLQSPAQRYAEQVNRPITDADRANTLVQAGNQADAGVKAAMVVTSPQYAVMAAAAVVEAAPAVTSATRTATTAVNNASINVYVRVTTAATSAATAASTAATNAGGAISNAVARVATSPALSNAQAFLKGALSTTNPPPQNWAGISGRAARLVYEIGKRLLK